MTMLAKIKKHLETLGTISIREANDDYQLSGGSLTKYISVLKKQGLPIERVFKKNKITGRKYARYYLQG